MSENNPPQEQPESTPETVTETEKVVTPGLNDKREELRTPSPEVVRETVTETTVDDAGKGSE